MNNFNQPETEIKPINRRGELKMKKERSKGWTERCQGRKEGRNWDGRKEGGRKKGMDKCTVGHGK